MEDFLVGLELEVGQLELDETSCLVLVAMEVDQDVLSLSCCPSSLILNVPSYNPFPPVTFPSSPSLPSL